MSHFLFLESLSFQFSSAEKISKNNIKKILILAER